ncbi:MAG: HypC/HybG/HupF family hydrogenase formation chaperone [Candidatus Aenigmarchaeota archaeon]|nr:HypC/HybG/HupF family hydrogenase formation chaperone [Candidatus Aenigmarchaeota archaeon]
MCYAIPARVIEINSSEATVDYGGIIKVVNIDLVDNINIGDYILIHAGFAIEKLAKESAEESLSTLKEYFEEVEKSGQ